MKCIGRTKKIERCKNDATHMMFCQIHKFQWLTIILPTLTLIGILGGIYQDLWIPFSKNEVTIIDTSVTTKNKYSDSSSDLIATKFATNDSIVTPRTPITENYEENNTNSPNKDLTINLEANLSEYDFPEVTFTLRNEGNMEAYFNEFEIELSNFKLDVSPDLKLRSFYCSDTSNPQIFFYVQNNGWGPAKDLQINDLGYFNEFASWNKKNHFDIESGEEKLIFEVPLFTNNGNKNKNNFNIQLAYTRLGTRELIDKNIFIEKRHCDSPGVKLNSDTTYISFFKSPDGTDSGSIQKKSYSIKRIIPARGHDIFTIKLGIDKSCSVTAKFNFKIDKKIKTSESINLLIWNPVESGLNKKYDDGKIF